MPAATLTDDQRQLLLHHCGSWLLAATISDLDYGLDSIKSRAGGRAWPSHFHPELPFNRTWVRGEKIVGYSSGRIVPDAEQSICVQVSFTRIRGWVEQLTDDTRAGIRATFREMADEQNRTMGWCRCPWKDQAPNEFSSPCKRYHPTDAEDEQRWANRREIEQRQEDRVRAALGLSAEFVGQLGLFEVPA